MKAWLSTLVICIVILVSLGGVKGWQISQALAFAAAMPEYSETVKTATTEVVNYEKTVTVTGTVLAPRQVSLYTEIAGRITQVGFQSGGSVNKGQLLLQLDSSEEEALLASANANLRLAETLFKRSKNLRQTNAVSEEHFDRARLELAQAKAEVVRLISMIRKKKVIAPFAGNVDLHQFEVGQYLNPNTMVTQLLQVGEWLWVDFKVPQIYPELSTGQTILVQKVSADDHEFSSGEVISKQAKIELTNRSIGYRSKVKANQINTPVNGAVVVKVPVQRAEALIQVPATSLQQDSLGYFVYLLVPEKIGGQYRAQRQNVELQEKYSDRVILQSGIERGQLIAADGAFKLFPGVLVNVDQSVNQSSNGM